MIRGSRAVLLTVLLSVASPAGSVVLASAWAPMATAGGLWYLSTASRMSALGLLAIPGGFILGLRTVRKYPERLLRRRLRFRWL